MVIHWIKNRDTGSNVSLCINGCGAFATCTALVVVLVAKFLDGAWITILLIPAFLVLFKGVKAHYRRVAKEIACSSPINLTALRSPLVVVPVKSWNTITERALLFGMTLSEDIIAVHISSNQLEEKALQECWQTHITNPVEAVNRKPPKLVMIPSPYRKFFTPFLSFIDSLKDDHPGQNIAVIIPELVEPHWYQYFLHNQQATGLKAALLFRGGDRVVVINVPWYLCD